MEHMLATIMVIALFKQILLMSNAIAPMDGLDQLAIEVLRLQCQQIIGFDELSNRYISFFGK